MILSLFTSAAPHNPCARKYVYKPFGPCGNSNDVSSNLDDRKNITSLFDTAKLVREVAIALMGGHYVSIPCAGGGSVSSETGWDGRKKDEEDENFRLRCWLHAAKTVKASHNIQTKRKSFGR